MKKNAKKKKNFMIMIRADEQTISEIDYLCQIKKRTRSSIIRELINKSVKEIKENG